MNEVPKHRPVMSAERRGVGLDGKCDWEEVHRVVSESQPEGPAVVVIRAFNGKHHLYRLRVTTSRGPAIPLKLAPPVDGGEFTVTNTDVVTILHGAMVAAFAWVKADARREYEARHEAKLSHRSRANGR